MSSLMASSAPAPKMLGEPHFSRAVSSALQDMKGTPTKQEAQQLQNGTTASALSTSPPFREKRGKSSSPEEGRHRNGAAACADEGGIDLLGKPLAFPFWPPLERTYVPQKQGDLPALVAAQPVLDQASTVSHLMECIGVCLLCADVDTAELAKHARRVVQRSAHMAAADRGRGVLTSLSAHVTVGAAEWTGNTVGDFAFDEDAGEREEDQQSRQSTGSQPSGSPLEHHTTIRNGCASSYSPTPYQAMHAAINHSQNIS